MPTQVISGSKPNEQVIVLKSPISERYCKEGDEATLDRKNGKIRCSGAWFNFDERWTVKSVE